MKKVAIYYRTSKRFPNQEKMQRIKCREYCKDHNLEIFKEYTDLNVSGLRRNRTELNKLLKESDKFSEVVIYSFDRLGRSTKILNNISGELEKKNIKISSVTQEFNENTPSGKFMKQMLFSLAEYESSVISNRTKDGLKARKKT